MHCANRNPLCRLYLLAILLAVLITIAPFNVRKHDCAHNSATPRRQRQIEHRDHVPSCPPRKSSAQLSFRQLKMGQEATDEGHNGDLYIHIQDIRH